ncbi:MAG TPA: FAD-dependent oxidoreductase, partial [Terriglobales bacterium]|nr:FAD-dependent oxidoreductase [Terriglobales bacterium]
MSDGKKVAIIGAGPGGYAAAFLAADLGMDVTLIGREPDPGGVCLYVGCIPSKALLHAAKIVSEAREAIDLGIDLGSPRIDLPKLRGWKEGVVRKLTGGLGQLAKQRKVQYLRGTAEFVDSKTLRITGENLPQQTLQFDNIVIATGSRPVTVPSLAIKSDRVMDSTAALELKDVP